MAVPAGQGDRHWIFLLCLILMHVRLIMYRRYPYRHNKVSAIKEATLSHDGGVVTSAFISLKKGLYLQMPKNVIKKENIVASPTCGGVTAFIALTLH